MSEPAKSSGFGVRGSGDAFVFVEAPGKFHDPVALVVRIPQGIRSKQKLFAALADKLRFPRYFGWNWMLWKNA